MDQTALELDDEVAEPTFSVGELTTRVRDVVRDAFPDQVWVRGEVQGFRRHANGHLYFSLVEKAGRGDRVQARLDCVLFRDDRRPVERALAEVPGAELGDDVDVRIRGRVAVYPAQGRLQFVMSAIDPVFTIGGIAANRARVLHALGADGLLEANARRPLPLVPLRVGLVTSRGSAAYHDFVHELEASGYAWQVGVFDVRVQGAAASRRIAYVLRELARRDIDVAVLVRGGGARADLVPFDSEQVARAVAAMPVPVFVGVGHETDRSVADEVAHSSCKTPTACAQMLVQRVRDLLDGLDDTARLVVTHARARGALATRELDDAARRVRRGAPAAVVREEARLAAGRARVEELGRRRTRDARAVLGERERAVITLSRHHLDRSRLRIDAAEGHVRALDPRRVLERGYSITRDADGRVVRRVAATAAGAELVTELADGHVTSRVEKVEPVESVESVASVARESEE
jgi:exodeoxyribonuclease VII large subunit